MNWQIEINSSVRKALHRIPRKDAERVEEVLVQIESDPFSGDVQKMRGKENTWRRRIGSYRLFYDIFTPEKTVLVFDLERRGSKTY